MATASYLIKFGADASSVSKAITSVNSDIRSLNSQARSLDTAFKLTGDTSVLSQKLNVLKSLISNTELKSQGLQKQLNSLRGSAGFDENSTKAVNLRNQIAQTDAQAVKLKAQLATASSRGLDTATSSSGSLNKSIGAGTIAMGTFVGSLASKAISAGIGLITNNLGSAISRIDTLNNSARNFENMGVSVGVVNKQMGVLQGAIKGLPTGLDSAVSGVQLLTSSLNGDMPQSVSVFKALNDGILGFGGSSEQVTNAVTQLSQSFANGKIDGETWNSMINSGLGPSLNAIAKTMGITTGQLKDGLSTGNISVSQFNDALVNLDKNGGGGLASLSQIAQDGTKGIATSMTNAKTAVTRGVADMVTSIDKGIGSLNIETPLGKITGIGSIFTQLGTVGEQAFSGLGSVASTALGSIGSYIGTLQSSVSGINFSGITSALSGVGSSISSFFGSLKFDGLTNLVDAILPALVAGFQSFLGWVAPAFQPLLSAVTGLWNALQPVFTIIAGSLTPAFQVLGSFLGGFVSGVMSGLTFALQVVTVAVQILTPVIQVLGDVFNALSPIISFVAGIIGTVLGTSINILGGIFSWLSGVVSSVWGTISGVIGSAGGAISGIFSMLSGAVQYLAGFFSSAGSQMGGAMNGASGVISGAGRVIGGVATSIIGFFSGIGGKIASGFNGVVGAITSRFSGVMESISGMFSGAVDIGANIVEGIKNGITGAIGGLVSTAANMASQALSSAKRALGIHSPSRVFRDEVGKFIPAGIGVGINSNLGTLDTATDSIKSRLLGGFESFDLGNVSANVQNQALGSGTDNANSTIININVTADSTSNANNIATQIKTVLRQQGINAR